jgi:hypothetical protein
LLFWLLALAHLLALVGAYELGYRIGRHAMRTATEGKRPHDPGWQAEVIGLLGLLVAFSFGMAVARFDGRRQLVVDEANAIGTAYLRTDFLDEAPRREVRALFRRYVDLRIEYHEALANRARLVAALQAITPLQAQIWARVTAAARADPRAMPVALLVQSTNEMIDLEGKQRAALFNHIPWAVFVMLVLVAGTALAQSGYTSGLGGRRHWFGRLVMPVLIASVVTLVFNIDYPRVGIVRVGQQSMISLRDSL